MINNVRNAVFYEAAKSYVKASLELIISCLQSGEQVLYEIVEEYDFEKTETYMRFGTNYPAKPLYRQLMPRHKDEIHSLPEYETCKRIMKSDPVMSKHIDTPLFLYNTGSSYPTETYLDYLLVSQLESAAEKLEFNLDIFNEAYRNLEVFFQNDRLMMRTVAPLHNFQCDANLVDLGDGLRIRRIERTEQEQLLHEFKWSPSMSLSDILDLKYVIENSHETEKVFNYSLTLRPKQVFRSGHREINRLLIALRLFKSGVIGINATKTYCVSEIPLSIGGGSNRSSPGSFVGEKYALTGSEIQGFIGFWSKLKAVDLTKPAQLGIALRRFSYAYERENLEDKLIDLLVAFEALFFKKDELTELGHRLSTRVSRLLEQEYDKRKDVFERMKSFYKMRSKVVHGEQVDELQSDSIRTIEDYLRRSLKLFLECSQMDFDEVLTRLDLD